MGETMRAWQTVRAGTPREALALRGDAPVPAPREGTVLVDVAAAGIGLPDALMCEARYALTPPLPFTQGQEVAGRIAALGPGAEGLRVGERVMAVTSFFTGHGSFAERCLGLADFCLPVPDDMSDAEAACFLIPLHTAYIGLVQRARLAKGETLLVLGASGGTGSAAVQVGRALGARVIAAAGGPEKARYCAEQGAHDVVDHRAEDVAKVVQALTGGRGADVVYDPVGGDAFRAATRCIAHEGRLLAVGAPEIVRRAECGDFAQPGLQRIAESDLGIEGVDQPAVRRLLRQQRAAVDQPAHLRRRQAAPLGDPGDQLAVEIAGQAGHHLPIGG